MDFKAFKEKFQKEPVGHFSNGAARKPMVSVCVMTYQHADYIAGCLEGILRQKTDFPFEILLGEDSSSDGTREICMDYAKKHPDKIRLFLHKRENNISIGGAPTGRFNFVYNLFLAKGKYIAVCEGDDYWTDPLKLQKQVDFLEGHPDYVLTHHEAKVIDEKGRLVKKHNLPQKNRRDFTAFEVQKGIYLLTLTLCFRNIIRDYPKEFLKVLNGDKFLISLLGNYGKAKFMGSINPGVYRVHSGGIWSAIQIQKRQMAVLNTSEKLKAYYQRTGKKALVVYFDKKADAIKMLLILGYLQDKRYGEYLKALAVYFSSWHNLFFKLYHCPAAHFKLLKKKLMKQA